MKTKMTLLLLAISVFAYSQKFIKYDREDFTSSTTNIYTVFVDKSDNVYAGSSDQLFRFNGIKWDSLNINDRLPGFVKSITQDKTDSIRFGVINNGIYSTLDLTSVNRKSPQIANSWVNVLATDVNGKIWVGTTGGISVIDGTNVTNYTSANGLKGNAVSAIKISSNGKIYIGTEAGVSIYDNGNWSYINVDNGLVSNIVKAIEIDSNGHLWIGTYDKGISMYDGENWITYNKENTNGTFVDNEIKDLLWDGNSMWVAGFYLARFANNTWTKYTILDKAPSFPDRLDIDSKGNIWISSLTSITMYNKSSETPNSNIETNENLIIIYPNPTKDFINLSVTTDNCLIEIFNMNGSLVYSSYSVDNQIDITGLNKGCYIISIKNKEGKIIKAKIIKK